MVTSFSDPVAINRCAVSSKVKSTLLSTNRRSLSLRLKRILTPLTTVSALSATTSPMASIAAFLNTGAWSLALACGRVLLPGFRQNTAHVFGRQFCVLIHEVEAYCLAINDRQRMAQFKARIPLVSDIQRSEERRVGKEGRSR